MISLCLNVLRIDAGDEFFAALILDQKPQLFQPLTLRDKPFGKFSAHYICGRRNLASIGIAFIYADDMNSFM